MSRGVFIDQRLGLTRVQPEALMARFAPPNSGPVSRHRLLTTTTTTNNNIIVLLLLLLLLLLLIIIVVMIIIMIICLRLRLLRESSELHK